MISKVMNGSGFAGALGYASEKDDAEFIVKGGVFSADAKGIAAEMRSNADQRSIKTPVMHVALSLPPGESATADQWKIAAEAYLVKMGFDLNKSQFAVYRHHDRDHDHIHIIANRVQLDGKVISDSHHWRRSHEATRHAEKAAGLSQLQPGQAKIQKGHLHQLRSNIDSALAGGATLAQFGARLAQAGIKVQENRASTGRLAGISFKDKDGRVWKGSALGRDYSLLALSKRGLNLDYQSKPQKLEDLNLNNAIPSPALSMPSGITAADRNRIRWRLRNTVGGLSVGEKDKLARKAKARQKAVEL